MTESYIALTRSLLNSGCEFEETDFVNKYQEIITEYYQNREIDLIERPIEEVLLKALNFFQQGPIPDEALNKAIADMYRVTESHWKIEPDTHETLSQLKSKGFRLGLISNASNSPDLNRLIDSHDLRKYFECIVISAEESIRKPDRRIFKIAFDRMRINPQNAIMVGDTLNADIYGAQQAGMRAIWISRRAQRPDNINVNEWILPDWTINDLASLLSLVDVSSRE